MSRKVESGSEPFWEQLAGGEFRVPECRDCGEAFFPPGPLCPHCGGREFDWTSGETGTLYSFTRQHRTAPGFDAPVVMGIVELAAGPRLLAPIAADYDDLTIGQPVRVVPRDYEQDYDREEQSDRPFFAAVPADQEDVDR